MSKKIKVNIKEKEVSTNWLKVKKKPAYIFILIFISIFTFVSFYPSLKNDFTNWDDPSYIQSDTMIFDLKYDNIKQMFSKQYLFNYHPLTLITYAVDYKFAYNDDTKTISAKPFHLTNILFHIINTLLIFYFIYLLSGNSIAVAIIVSLLFGVHPLRVESVTWVSERKDVLFALFYILSMIVYLKYKENRKLKLYLLITFLYIFSILSKVMAISLPLALLAIDWYKDNKITKNQILEKIPFFVFSIIFGVIGIYIQEKGGAVTKFEVFSIFERISIASYGFTMYLYKLILPINLSSYYMYPHEYLKTQYSFPLFYYLFNIFPLIICTILYFTRKYTKVLIFGFLFYFLTIAIVLQFISVGSLVIAERYTYISYISLFFIIGMLYKYLDNKSNKSNNSNTNIYTYLKYFYALILAIFIIYCSYKTFNRTKVWKNSETLWTDVIDNSPIMIEDIYLNRAYYYYLEGDRTKDFNLFEKSMKDYRKMILLRTKNPFVFSVMANMFVKYGELDSAIKYFNKAILIDTLTYNFRINRALTYIKKGEYKLSLDDIEKVLKIVKIRQPYVLQAYNYFMLNDYEKSIPLYSNIISKYDDYYDAYYYRGISYFKLQQYDNSLSDLIQYLKYNEHKADVYYYISEIYNIKKISIKLFSIQQRQKKKDIRINHLLI